MRKFTAAVACAVLLGSAAIAHDCWLMPAAFRTDVGQPIDVAVEVGDRFGASDSATKVERVASLTARGPGSAAPFDLSDLRVADVRLLGTFIPATPGTWLIACEIKPRFIELDADQFNEYLLHDGLAEVHALRKERGQLGAKGRERYARSIKTFVRAGSPAAEDRTFAQVLGTLVELVPEADPLALAVGDRLPVRLLFGGKPCAGHAVAATTADHSGGGFLASARTDADGRASFAIDRPGRWLVRTICMREAPGDPEVDWESFWATLTFDVPAARAESR